ncbi:hypothetical protein [Pseudomonas phage vB_PaeM-G11]|uniref:Uncharacterized protein n=1 Tax=Pseudomonas phage vB_PaeM-G11 TaxID=3034915 RepID=A0AAF0I945_9CAUD|nr:hypothetical protein [Pseudomonas sp. D3]WEM05603.1 hypothetical protein [Pseudomonas phage vB_PaeM-G11]WET13033.1 hypothetical protein P3S72_13175 [Pseudomonas sp. D3]
MEEHEKFIREHLVALQREYMERAKPWVDQLVQIESMKPVRYLLTLEQAAAMGIYPKL